MLKTKAIQLFLVVAAMMLAALTSAFAVSKNEVLRVEQNASFQGLCCFTWLEHVSVNEPAAVVPAIVTWSTDYQATGYFFTGLSLNGGPCQFYGSAVLAPVARLDGFFDSQATQSVIFPGDGLVRGKNTITVCGGAVFSAADTITLGFNTLSVRIAK